MQLILNMVSLNIKKLLNMLYDKIIIEFIVKLLKLKDLIINKKYNSILVIVGRLTKYFYILLFKKKYIVEQLEAILPERLIWY